MIFTITLKELHQHLISLRFIVCFILSVILIGISVYIRYIEYSGKLRDYNAAITNSKNEMKNVQAFSFLQPRIYRPPAQGSIFVEGIEGKVGNEVTICHYHIPVKTTGGETVNQFATLFRSFDFSKVVIILLSILAFLISYDAISGEKERGLLRVSLSNSIPRHHILVAKYLGGLLPLFFTLFFGILTGIFMLFISQNFQITYDFLARIGLILFVNMIFLSLMLLLGMVISSVTQESFSSLVYLLFIWILFIFIVPKLSTYISERLKPVITTQEVNDRIEQLKTEMNQKINNYQKTIKPQRTWRSSSSRGEKGFMLTIYGNPPETVEYHRQFYAFSGPLQMDYAQLILNKEKQRFNDLSEQANFAQVLSLVSPSGICKKALMVLAGTDRANYEKFLNDARNYRLQFIDYLQSNGGFSSYKYFMQYEHDPDDEKEKILYAKLSEISKLRDQPSLTEAEKENFNNQYRKVRDEDVPNYLRTKKWVFDLSDMPVFTFHPCGFLNDIKRSLRYIALLIFFNLLLFLYAHVSFLKFDIR